MSWQWSDMRARLEAEPGRRAQLAVAAVFALLVLFSCSKAYLNAIGSVSSDLRTYYVAADDIANGRTPYVQRGWLNDYIYPPFFCWAFSPLTFMPLEWAAVAWSLVNAALWPTAALLALRVSPLPGWMALLPSLFAIRPIMNNWGHGQVNLLLLALVVYALLLYKEGRLPQAGIALGVAMAVKIVPGLFVAAHALRREWRLVLPATAVAAICVLAPAMTTGTDSAVAYVGDWLRQIGRHTTDLTMYTTAKNQSLFGCLMRFLTDTSAIHYKGLQGVRVNVAALDSQTVGRIFLGVSLAMLAAMAWRLLRTRGAPELEYVMLYLSLPLLSKTAMEHHWVVLLFAYTVMIHRARERRRLWLPIGAAVFLTTFNTPLLFSREWTSRLQALSPSTLALMVLWVTVFWMLGEPQEAAAASR